MKQLLNIALLITLFSCKAQTIIVPLGSGQDYELTPDYYLKDVNNEFGKFEGTWKYQNGNTQIIFKLKKETHYQISSDSDYEDLLVGEYQYTENGTEIANTLSDFNNPSILGYSHNVNGSVFTHRLPGNCTDNSDLTEIKIELFLNHPTEEYTEGRVILRYVDDNGTEKLQACIYDYTTMGNIQDARIDIPDGYYVFVKQ
jgi:hypothetical protein